MPKRKNTKTSAVPPAPFLDVLEGFLSAWEQRDVRRLQLDEESVRASATYKQAQTQAMGRLMDKLSRLQLGPQPVPFLHSPEVIGTYDNRRTSPLLSTRNSYSDARGHIYNLANAPVGSVVLITSKAGSTRAKHWHREDSHACYVLKGHIDYYERPHMGDLIVPVMPGEQAEEEMKKLTRIQKFSFTEGDMFYTGPRVEHEMYFPVDTEFLTLGGLSRKSEDYEDDLVRLEKSLREEFSLQTTQS